MIIKYLFEFALHIRVRQHMRVKLLQLWLLATHQLEEAGIQGEGRRCQERSVVLSSRV